MFGKAFNGYLGSLNPIRQRLFWLACLGFSLNGLTAAAGLTIRVFDDYSDQPMQDARVSIDGNPAQTTSATGKIFLSETTPGKHKLLIAKDGYKTTSLTVEIIENADNSVIVDMVKGIGIITQELSQPESQVVELQEVRVTLLTLND